MTLTSIVCTLILALRIQGSAPPVPQSAGDCVIQVEKARLSAAKKIDDRIKVYSTISERLHQTIMGAAAKGNFDSVPFLLGCWKDQLTGSLKDIDANVNRKKKSGALINYEIQLRKSLVDVRDAQLKAPSQQQSDFESWLSQAEKVHEKFVDILFMR